ncbi:hypothetical protein CCACVL1_16473 [Corchorus capsularis]|uniref:Uncharacterized protein n=1 Tax=Corchorus capsularis TaxID=210143 RepID=A0A1R3HWX3_COCAP|nr:hypothetical protein CCACVL1_16473 [Corchorus capsularis]
MGQDIKKFLELMKRAYRDFDFPPVEDSYGYAKPK